MVEEKWHGKEAGLDRKSQQDQKYKKNAIEYQCSVSVVYASPKSKIQIQASLDWSNVV